MVATIAKNTFTYSGINPGRSLFLLGDDMSLLTSQNNPNYIVKWYANTLNNQYSNTTSNYTLYEGTAGENLIIL